MIKTLTCRELGGTCDEEFSGEKFNEIMQKAMPHMMEDEAHKAAVMNMETTTGDNKEQWMARMHQEFDAKPEDS
jgi:predicted small metal-binding protein